MTPTHGQAALWSGCLRNGSFGSWRLWSGFAALRRRNVLTDHLVSLPSLVSIPSQEHGTPSVLFNTEQILCSSLPQTFLVTYFWVSYPLCWGSPALVLTAYPLLVSSTAAQLCVGWWRAAALWGGLGRDRNSPTSRPPPSFAPCASVLPAKGSPPRL